MNLWHIFCYIVDGKLNIVLKYILSIHQSQRSPYFVGPFTAHNPHRVQLAITSTVDSFLIKRRRKESLGMKILLTCKPAMLKGLTRRCTYNTVFCIAFTKVGKDLVRMPFPYKICMDFIAHDEHIMFNTNIAEAFQLVLSPPRPTGLWGYTRGIMLYSPQ